jgi:hypothetical protein
LKMSSRVSRMNRTGGQNSVLMCQAGVSPHACDPRHATVPPSLGSTGEANQDECIVLVHLSFIPVILPCSRMSYEQNWTNVFREPSPYSDHNSKTFCFKIPNRRSLIFTKPGQGRKISVGSHQLVDTFWMTHECETIRK